MRQPLVSFATRVVISPSGIGVTTPSLRTIFAISRLIYDESSSAHVGSVESGDGFQSLVIIRHLDKRETF